MDHFAYLYPMAFNPVNHHASLGFADINLLTSIFAQLSLLLLCEN